MPDESVVYRFGPFTFYRDSLVLLNGRTGIRLRRQAASLLLFLLDHRGAPVSRTEIGNHLWEGGPPRDIKASHQISTCIRLIRLALNDLFRIPTYVATWKNGYQFIAPVSVFATDVPNMTRMTSGKLRVRRGRPRIRRARLKW